MKKVFKALQAAHRQQDTFALNYAAHREGKSVNQHDAMQFAEQFYYSPAMKLVLPKLTSEWQTATQLSAKWTTLNALVARGKAERRENPVFNTGIDAHQWRRAQP